MSLNQKQIEEGLISSILLPEHLSEITLEGITTEYFIIHRELFSFIQKYSSKLGNIPSRQILQSNYPDFSFINNTSDDQRKYFIEELIKSDVQRKAIQILNKGADLVAGDIYGGIDFILSKLTQVRKLDSKYSISYTDRDALRRLDEFNERKNKISKGLKLGLRTGFSLFDNDNIGWQPGNLVGIIGRMNIGKSFLLMYTGCSSYIDGHKVVYLSPEMTVQEDELRWDTMMSSFYNYEFPNDSLILGKADSKKYKEWLSEISKNSKWITMDSNHGKPFTLESIEAITEEFQPDLLCIDGFLELRSATSGMDKSWQVMLDIAYGLKSIAQNNKIVVIVTSQAKRFANNDEREAMGNMPGLEQVYGGDALGQASDVIITMANSDKEENTRYISVPKRRGGKVYTKRMKLQFDVNLGKIGC